MPEIPKKIMAKNFLRLGSVLFVQILVKSLLAAQF